MKRIYKAVCTNVPVSIAMVNHQESIQKPIVMVLRANLAQEEKNTNFFGVLLSPERKSTTRIRKRAKRKRQKTAALKKAVIVPKQSILLEEIRRQDSARSIEVRRRIRRRIFELYARFRGKLMSFGARVVTHLGKNLVKIASNLKPLSLIRTNVSYNNTGKISQLGDEQIGCILTRLEQLEKKIEKGYKQTVCHNDNAEGNKKNSFIDNNSKIEFLKENKESLASIYEDMLRVGIPKAAVSQKMSRDGINPEVLFPNESDVKHHNKLDQVSNKSGKSDETDEVKKNCGNNSYHGRVNSSARKKERRTRHGITISELSGVKLCSVNKNENEELCTNKQKPASNDTNRNREKRIYSQFEKGPADDNRGNFSLKNDISNVRLRKTNRLKGGDFKTEEISKKKLKSPSHARSHAEFLELALRRKFASMCPQSPLWASPKEQNDVWTTSIKV